MHEEKTNDTAITSLSQSGKEKASPWHNLDLISTASFVGAALFGVIGASNNVRHIFWNSFIQGFGYVETPFASIRHKFEAKFKQVPRDYEAGKITASEYCVTMRDYARDYRKEVNTKLLKEFNIPTNGPIGWTIGTVKRIKELSVNGRFHGVLGFATVGAIGVGAVSLLSHSKHTLDRIENRFDALHDPAQTER